MITEQRIYAILRLFRRIFLARKEKADASTFPVLKRQLKRVTSAGIRTKLGVPLERLVEDSLTDRALLREALRGPAAAEPGSSCFLLL